MITINALSRTFWIKFGTNTGTCFVIDVDKKQYLVTAQHIVKGIQKSGRIEIFRNSQWDFLDVVLVGKCGDDDRLPIHGGEGKEVDIAVFTPTVQLAASDFLLTPSSERLTFGQDVFLLGFPKGLYTPAGNFAVPFIKTAIVSCKPGAEEPWYLDGLNLLGFSGGPVVFATPGTTELKVAAVISGLMREDDPILSKKSHGSSYEDMIYRRNTGITIAFDIRYALKLIQENPIGYEIE
jgi:hypothetical protein